MRSDDPKTNFPEMILKDTELDLARERAELADLRLELASIQARHARLKSQFQPMDDLRTTNDLSDREKILQAIFWVLFGRFDDWIPHSERSKVE